MVGAINSKKMDVPAKKKPDQGNKRRILILLALVIFTCVLALLLVMWENLFKRDIVTQSGINFNLNYEPQNAELYTRMIWSVNNKTSPYGYHPKSLDEREITEPVIELNLANAGFENPTSSSGGQAMDWSYIGMLEYTNSGCYAGKKCLYVRADDSNYGYGIINSKMIPVKPGTVYKASFKINCLDCSGDSAYIALIWMMKNESSEYQVQKRPLQEVGRVIRILNNTNGYETKSIYARAPELAQFVIAGIRFHEEGARITKLTEFYVDGEN
jgi:hypothetical protein